jgi:type VI secretion system protein ImpA
MPLRTDLLDPIDGPNPAGTDLTYELILDELQEARREDIDVEQGEWERPLKKADYAKVIELGGEILAKSSKDLTVAAWMTEALLYREGFPGLREGLDLMHGILTQYWENAFPELEEEDTELRAGPLNWIGSHLEIPVKRVALDSKGHDFFQYGESRLTPSEDDASLDTAVAERRQAAIDEGKLTPEEFDKGFKATTKQWYKDLVAGITAVTESVGALDELGREKFGDYDAPTYVGLSRVLEEVRIAAQALLDEKLRLDPDPIEAEPVPSVDAGSSESGSDSGGQVLSMDPVSTADAAARIEAAARFLRREDPKNPGPYLLLRGYRWGELRAVRGSMDPRLLDAPPTATRKHLKGLLLDGKWEELLDAGEQVMASPHGRGWLDLQRYVLTACEHLGSEYDQVAHAIRGELRAVLVDIPQLLQATLMDDTPTANAETMEWLRATVIGDEALAEAQGAAAERVASASMASGLGGRGVVDRAMAQVRAGEPQKAIEILMTQAEQEKSERARFLSRSEAVAVMVDARLTAVALPILRELYEQVAAHNLEEWEEGEVIARPLGLLHRCLDSTEYELQNELYQRICRLDPLLAISFNADEGPAEAESAEYGQEEVQDYSQEYGQEYGEG